ncbi:hypothetical protein [Luxibacter massiliensis]|uniref:hypothetical protein n=1 Tax=Luxibacter massiliensis TaxID=2219695 RepID=UPI000F046293|nr:hypothetical protein [Luxibacter massiliensis]
MLQGIETIFDDKEKMMRKLKKKSYESNSKEFMERNGHFFREMTEYIGRAENKEAAALEIGEALAGAVKKRFAGKKERIDGRTQVDLNFFMIYYVFPSILGTGHPDSNAIAEGVRTVWDRSFKGSNIKYADYDTLYESFHEKILGIF